MYTLEDLSSQTGLSHKEIQFYIQQGVIENTKSFCSKDIIMLYKLLILKALEFSYTAIYTILTIDTIDVWAMHLKEQQTFLDMNKLPNRRNRLIISEMLEMIKENKMIYWEHVFYLFKLHYNENDSTTRPKSRTYMKDFLRVYDSPKQLKNDSYLSIPYVVNSKQKISS
ncbi:MAG: hypothetical protein ACI35O_13440 [Bacillaceae bacterium]